MDFQGSAGQDANGDKREAAGPTRRLVIQAWIHGFSWIFRDLLAREFASLKGAAAVPT